MKDNNKKHNHNHEHDHKHEHSHEHTDGVGCSGGCCSATGCSSNGCSDTGCPAAGCSAVGCSAVGCSADSDGCDCGHSHDKKGTKVEYILWGGSVLAFMLTFLPLPNLLRVILYAVSVLLAGYDILFGGLKELLKLKLRENALLLIAVVASFVLLEFSEACIVTILFKLGHFLEAAAIAKSKKSMESLTEIRPDIAVIKNPSKSGDTAEFEEIDAKKVKLGDTVYLRAGDRVALDCVVTDGSSSVDTSALTGEAIPEFVQEGSTLLSGSVNLSGLLSCKVTKSFENSTASQIVEMVYSSMQKKGKTENFISRFAKYYTPIVVILAVLIAVVPPVFSLGEWSEYINRALIFLVASCPCALVISIPLSFFSTIGAESKLGVLVKGSKYIEALAKATAVCLDKTGTITTGKLKVENVQTFENQSKNDVLTIAYSLEQSSTHPIAQGIAAMASELGLSRVGLSEVTEYAGMGVSAVYNGKKLLCGNKRLLSEYAVDISALPQANVYVCEDKRLIGAITLSEEISPENNKLAADFAKSGINRVVMLTGDNEQGAKKIAEKCGITEYHAALLPKNKVEQVEKVKKDGEKVIFVGDGINDAPVIAASDLGISMGLGSSIANVTSDIILASNKISVLPKAISLAKRGMRVAGFNIAFALLIKAIVLVLGATGYGTMWLAVFADIGVTILSVINSMRILKFK